MELPRYSSPASRLPVELLREIFLYAAPFRQRPPISTTICCVGRRWRYAAYSVKGLWTDVPVENEMWTELALTFSSREPISLVSDSFLRGGVMNSRVLPGLQSALRHSPRIREILLKKDHFTQEDLSLLKGARLPSLERLRLQSCKYWFELPNAFFEVDEAPQLAELVIHRLWCKTPTPSPLFRSSLRSLELHHCQDVFRHIPLNQHVVLNLEYFCVIDSCPNTRAAPYPRIHLPKLQHLYVQDTGVKVSKFLERLRFSGVASEIVLDCEIHHRFEEIPTFLKYLSRHVSSLMSTTTPALTSPYALRISDPLPSGSQISTIIEHNAPRGQISQIAHTMRTVE
ncbi:hypothetical protein BC834DRAFT_282704 [Gloeopeniophorella convolvens]|nr:hypothetical protein BC834DRAFT_282704 [Gloeopeniophorella convolvens]